ncbi:MAG: hypothetical protein PHY48_14590 [Candidatus Cloacimonetes bacterium]|jgi:hypothetical protein|nr:hypothetical protein [Candidatus Cloacimonadota bacterium]
MSKRTIIILAAVLSICMLGGQAKTKYKALNFNNPGTKRVLKSEAGNYYYYRSLPEKSMLLDTTGISKLELRSFSKDVLRKPEIIVIIAKNRQTYSLKQVQTLNNYSVYATITIDIPKNTKSIEVLCYSRSMYMRAFNILPPKAPKIAKLRNLAVKAHAGAVSLLHNGSSSDYYSLLPTQALKFSLNNKRNAIVYVRPRLLDRSIPKLGVYQNGKLVQTISFTIKRTNKYHVQGIKNLGISKKIELPVNNGSSDYELKALSDHLFIAKPVLLKLK